jgi:hypothetical protein
MTLSRRSDDLKRIKGIGPASESRLREAGIRTITQLGSLSPTEIANRVPGLSARRIAGENWCVQARQLTDKRIKIKHRRNATAGQRHQHYATFTVEFLLNEDSSVRRTRVVHIQSNAEATWSDWQEALLADFLVSHAGLCDQLPESSPSLESISPPEQILSTKCIYPTTFLSPPKVLSSSNSISPDSARGGPFPSSYETELSGVLRISELIVVPPCIGGSQRIMHVRQTFTVQCVLDLTQVISGSCIPLDYVAVVLAKKLGEKPRQIVGEARGTVVMPADRMLCTVEATITTQGTYRLESIVSLTQQGKESLPQHGLMAVQTSSLLQVF